MDFADIEEKITDALQQDVSALKTVETFGGDIAKELPGLPVQYPAAYVSFAGSKFKPSDGPNHTQTADFKVFVAVKNAKGNKAVRKSAGGAYDLINSVLACLTNQDFGFDMDRLMPVSVSLKGMGKETALYEMVFRTSFDVSFDY